MPNLQVVVGGQYGSEGKGAIAAYLCKDRSDLVAVRVGGSNAGHTVIGRCPPACPERAAPDGIGAHHPDAHPWRLRHVPVAAVTAPGAMLYLAAGSEIDPGVLLAEIRDLDLAGYGVSHRLEIHPQATLVEQRHKDHESYVALLETCGSTVKGVGSARADRAMRFASLVTDHPALADYSAHGATPQRYLATGYDVLIEGTQGYGLGLHAGNYPQCTSGDCTAMDFLAQAGVAPWRGKVGFEVWVVFRAYPIRVAGNSGPLADETTWADLGLPVEHTTVTRKVRRVGGWDMSLAADAMLANGHPSPNVHVALTMVDHVVPGVAGVATMGGLQACPRDTVTQYENYIQQRTSSLGHSIDIIGTGPSTVLDRFAVPEELTRYGF